ncbi:MAG TPA: prolipoprotein diacylglyceryl transferase family protein [Gemmataceae bacterium]|nr:prolipoprotein diacylglyceryl transferase family protein [Gemmataceae bacterium]
MQQVLFRIPIKIPGWTPEGIPIYGFAAMLLSAFVICTWLANRRAEKEGIRREWLQDLTVWLFVGGIVGARLTFLFAEDDPGQPWTTRIASALSEFLKIWNGGLVLYGSIIGGIVGYFLAYFLKFRKAGLSSWKLADVLAPSLAVGLCLGRIGCFLNGCCYGAVACPDCWQVHFPLSGMPRYSLVRDGYQTAAGFTMSIRSEDDRTVGAVAAGSPADESGLRSGDIIVKLREFPIAGEERAVASYRELDNYLGRDWTRGKNDLALTVRRGNQEKDLPPFAPRTIGLYPTQLYESISMLLVFLLLSAFWEFRRHPGEVMALLMFCYGVQRYVVEMLRDDPRPVGFEKYISLLLMIVGPVLFVWLRWLSGTAKGLAKGTA